MKRLPRIQAVCFDVGGTLIEPWPSVGHVYASVAEEAGFPPVDPALLNRRFTLAWRTKAGFDYSRQAWANVVMATFAESSDEFGVTGSFFERVYSAFAQAGAWKIHEDVVPTLEALKHRGLALGVISNWDDRLRPLLNDLNLAAFFQCVQVSGEVGFHKPSPEIFLHASAALGLPPGGILHVGDSEMEDVRGAQGAGLEAILLNRRDGRAPGSERVGAEIGSLGELLDLLE